MLPPIPRQKAKNVHLTASPHRLSVPPTITSGDGIVSRDVAAILTGIQPLPTSDNTPTRIFKATQAASITAIVECTAACRHLIPGLAELMKDRQAGGGVAGISNFNSKNFLLSSGSSDVVSTNELLLSQYTSMGGKIDDRQAALLTLGHPSLPSLQMVLNSASKGVNEYPPFMTMSVRDSAPQLKLEDPPKVVDDDDEMERGEEEDGNNDSKKPQLDVHRKFVVKGGMKGYRMSRSTNGVTTGCYYYEAIILGGDDERGRGVKRTFQDVQENTAGNESNKQSSSSSSMNNGHLRIGWSTPSGDLQAPVGYNEHSYAIRDISGSRIHQSRREDKWADGVSFGPGDVIGFLICLVNNEKDANASTSSSSNKPTTTTSISKESAEERRRKSEDGGSQDSDMSIDDDGGGKSSSSSTLTNHIRFFKNGMPLGENGIAFDNVIPGTYHPAISCYLDGSAQMNFGPYFVYPPQGLPREIILRPISDICSPPPAPEEAIEKIMVGEEGKKSFFTKKMDDNILSVFKELARLEVTARYFAYMKHLALHRAEIGALRKERGLSTGNQ